MKHVGVLHANRKEEPCSITDKENVSDLKIKRKIQIYNMFLN